MAGRTAVFLGAILLTMVALPLSASAYNSGGIEASEAQVAMIPSTGLAVGDSVTFFLTLTNTQQGEANNVGYAFYKNQLSNNNKFVQDVIDISGDTSETVSATWDGLLESDDKIWITFEYPFNSDNEVSFFVEFDVAGLPNLRIMQTVLTPATEIYAGDTVEISSLVKNTGTEPASASQLEVNLPGSINDQMISTDSLTPGQETWVNTSFTAPATGSYTIYLTPDYNDEVTEASEQSKTIEVAMLVKPRMDIYHVGELEVTPNSGSVNGPWFVNGTIGRIGDSGTTEVTMWLEIAHTDGMEVSPPFTVSLVGGADTQQSWSNNFDNNLIGSLGPGSYQITAVIDPFGDGGFTQEDTTNDRLSSNLIKLESPDVLVDSVALASTPVVQAGDKVTWGVTVTNLGGVQVSGNLAYTFEGVSANSAIIVLNAGESRYWTKELSTGAGSHTANFVAEWTPAGDSLDRDLTNNIATNSISVESKLVLNWAGSSLRILDLNRESVELPLDEGEEYIFAINLTSQELGDLSIDCYDATANSLIVTIPVNVSEISQKVSLECQFTATAPSTTIQMTPSDPAVTSTYTRKLSTTSTVSDSVENENSGMNTAALIGLAVVSLLVIFGLAIWLTRESEEEVERDIFEYCPACDGELEGDENRCPHCSFNLAKARKQFHACHECGESVPDLMDNCPYCGAEQDVSSFFEQRQRRERKVVPKEEVALPEIDENEVVTGSEDFDATVKEFGYDEEQFGDFWDENIATAEAEIAEIEQSYEEEVSSEGLTPEEIEEFDSQVTTRLKGLKEMSAGVQDLDDMLASKGELVSHKDDGADLSASDAEIRGRIFELTGEDGVMPGDQVHIGLGISDSSLAGNEIEETSSDFTVEDEDTPIAKIKATDELQPARQKPKRRQSSKKTAECGSCGAEIPIMAKECPVCGAEFE
jgi:RNA polymerase subunit RPABC4/transcription elongation factor Spt4